MNTTTKPARSADVHVSISGRDILGLLVSAMEEGSDYWIDWIEVVAGEPCDSAHDLARVPIDGGALRVHAVALHATPLRLLDWGAILHGLELMAKDYPACLADVIRGAAEADIGDLLLQLSLFDSLQPA